MYIPIYRIVTIVASLILYPGWLQAASFDCSQAGQPIEITICSSPELSALDETLADLYKAALAGSNNSEHLRIEQRKWLRYTRDSCLSSLCVRDAYRQRIAELTHSRLTPSAPPLGAVQPPTTFSQPVPALSNQADECFGPDPNNFDQVFACMNSVRHGAGQSVFVNRGFTSCFSVAMSYHDALRKGQPLRQQLSAEQLASLSPSCDMLARAMQALKGSAPFWSACTNYPGKFDPAHVKNCLNQFLPGYYGGRKTLESLNGCLDVTQQYELAIRSARKEAVSTIRGNRVFLNWTNDLPRSYEKPDCNVVVSLLGGKEVQPGSVANLSGKGSECLGYESSVSHVEKCLGADARRLTTCIDMRRAYEGKLRQSYGGLLPPGYTTVTCDQLAGLVGQSVAAQEALKAEGAARQRGALTGSQAIRAAPVAPVTPGYDAASPSVVKGIMSFLHMDRPNVMSASFIHGIFIAWTFLFVRQRMRKDGWIWFSPRFEKTIIGVHGLIAILGVLKTGIGWLGWAAIAYVIGLGARAALQHAGAFDPPQASPGTTGKRGSRYS